MVGVAVLDIVTVVVVEPGTVIEDVLVTSDAVVVDGDGGGGRV